MKRRKDLITVKRTTYGFIGCGIMGGAIAETVISAMDSTDEALLSSRTREKAEMEVEFITDMIDEQGLKRPRIYVSTNEDIAAKADYIFLCVKPHQMEGVLTEIRDILKNRQNSFVLVSMAAGIGVEKIQSMVGGDYPTIRIMPNMAVLVGTGVLLYSYSKEVGEDTIERFRELVGTAGFLHEIEENLMDAASAITGCAPAYMCMFVESIKDGAVACGMPADRALQMAAMTMAGVASMMLVGGDVGHPAIIREKICSPGGTTIEGVYSLEEHGFRGAVMDAIISAYEKTKELGS